MIKQVTVNGSKKWAMVHCHGKNKGKVISTFTSKEKALRAHRAYWANKKKSK